MSDPKDTPNDIEKKLARQKKAGYAMAMGFAGLLITFAWVLFQELR